MVEALKVRGRRRLLLVFFAAAVLLVAGAALVALRPVPLGSAQHIEVSGRLDWRDPQPETLFGKVRRFLGVRPYIKVTGGVEP